MLRPFKWAHLLLLAVCLGAVSVYAQTVPEVLYYKFNEGTGGTTANDANPGQGTATVNLNTANTWSTPGRLGAACISGGASTTGSIIQTGWIPNWGSSQSWTVEFWVNTPTGSTTLYYYCGCPTAGSWRVFTNGVAGAGNLLMRGPVTDISIPGCIDGTWHHVAWVYNAATGTVTSYRDGVQQNQTTGQAPNIVGSANYTVLGYGTNTGVNGLVDDFRVWATARTQAEIAASMNVELGGGDPEIDVQRPAASSIASGGNDALGDIRTGVASQYTYTIENLGATNTLNLTGTPLVAINNATNCTATVTTPPSAAITAGGTTTFTVDVTPTADGAFSYEISIANDDTTGSEDPYLINVAGTGVSPEIDVQRPAATSIADGGTDSVGGTVQATLTALTYTIENTGTGPLTLTGGTPVTITNVVNCTAVVSGGQPASPVAAGGGTATFNVDVTPTAVGAWSFEIDIASDDSDEANYDITVSGTASAAPAPEMDVQDPGSSPVADGGTLAVFGTVAGVSLPGTFTILNNGSATLNLTGTPVVAISGLNNCAATVTTQPGATIPVTGSDTFDLQVTPTAAGAWSFVVSIDNNDADENPYNFTVSGNAQAVAAPEMEVRKLSAVIADGSTDSVTNTGTLPFNVTYTIVNQGAAALSLTGMPTVFINGQVNCTAMVTTSPTSPLAAASGSETTDTLVIQVTPTAAGAFSFTISIDNDDADENPYNWTFSGHTTTPSTGSGGGGGDDGGCSTGNEAPYSWMLLLGLLSLGAVAIRMRKA